VPLRAGANNILVKTISTGRPVVFFQLGDEEDLMADDFNNNLWELVDGYEELAARRASPETDTEHVQRQVTITYRDSKAASVAVVGSFNGWSPANSAMRKNKYGEWEINLYLSPGRYTYRLRIDDAAEVVDPSSPYSEPDGYGGQNSVLYVQ
jgi:1,4-alpha-glucan branching enzyme